MRVSYSIQCLLFNSIKIIPHQLMYHCCITVVLFYSQSEIFKEEEFFIPALRLCGLKDTYYDKCVAEKAIHLSVHTACAMILHSRWNERSGLEKINDCTIWFAGTSSVPKTLVLHRLSAPGKQTHVFYGKWYCKNYTPVSWYMGLQVLGWIVVNCN